MAFWIFMLIMDLLIPLTMIMFGRSFGKNPPKTINNVAGYRTTMSKKSKETWQFAHQYCGRLWFIWGWVVLAGSIVVMLVVMGKSEDLVGAVGGILCVVQLIGLMLPIIPTERALRKNFDENGNRRNKD
ncbi:MAG: SdpI family protein [Cellulosilyticaceae bacterium]